MKDDILEKIENLSTGVEDGLFIRNMTEDEFVPYVEEFKKYKNETGDNTSARSRFCKAKLEAISKLMFDKEIEL